MIKAEFQNHPATLENATWSVPTDPGLERLLNAMAHADPDGPPTSDPDPDLTLAKAAAAELGGKILSNDQPEDYDTHGQVH